MSKYYMFEIESIVQTFTVLDTGKEISFGYSSAEEQECFKDVNGGDLILGYYNEPIDAVKILFEVKGHLEDTQIELVKKLEVKDGVCITSDIADDLRQKKLISIYKEKFDEIYEQMLRKQESGENADLEEEFRDYLKNVRELTNIRQVDELKKWSDILYGDGVISKNVYSITSYAEYAEIEDIIRNSSRYAIYKMEQKEKSPQSGLASDQGLTNYGKFLKYREENQKGNEKREERVTGFEIEKLNFTAPKLPVPQNYLVFGAPGTGKSHEVKELQESYFPDKNSYERVTFYSNYSYPNFVGTYKPKMEGKDIVYSYVPGPFIRILEKAYRNPDKNYLLVIEEINRANPAAAFGDIFQLLDRKNGRSEYSIETSEELKLFFAKRFVSGFDEMSGEEQDIALESFSKMYIPPNMYIWATMNSADQGVYPMDTAFKRRWDFKYIGINDNMESMQNVTFKIALASGEKKVNWNKLRMKINEVLSGLQCRVNEDKLLGPYFISSEVMAINKETRTFDESKFDNKQFIDAFKNKVIMYLFEDAAKQRRTEIFKECDEVTRFSSVCATFDKKGVEIFGREIADSVIEE